MILSCICIVLLVGVDQFIKYWAVHTLQPQGSIPFIKIGGKEVLNLTYLENQGAAFSSFSGMRWFLIAVTVLLMVICAVLMVKYRKRSKMIPICSALIIAGGIGNLIDRLFRDGKSLTIWMFGCFILLCLTLQIAAWWSVFFCWQFICSF